MPEKISDYTFPTDIWYGRGERKVVFPENWEVKKYDMQGHDSPVLTDEEIKKRIENPIDSKNIEEDAKGAKSAVIIFDDLTRPTKTERIAKIVLEKLKKAGVPKDSIRFIMAQGAHRTHSRFDHVKKLGEEILDEYPVYPHNPFHNCVRVGTTSFGTPLEINADFMACDYKIGIGGLIPHPMMGFGGGKLVVPGVASIETIRQNHFLSKDPKGDITPNAGWGCYGKNEHQLDVEEITKMAGLDFKIDAFFNYEGRMTKIYAGDPVKEHHKGVEEAEEYYATERAEDVDLVISNAFCKANEAGLTISQGKLSLKEEGGDFVAVTNIPEGLAPHYLYGRWGTSRIGGFDWNENKEMPERIKRMIVFTKYIDKGQEWWLGPRGQVDWCKEWNQVIDLVSDEPKEVALYPDGTIQLLVEECGIGTVD